MEDEFQFNFNHASRNGETVCRACIANRVPANDIVSRLAQLQEEADLNWHSLHGKNEPSIEWEPGLLGSPAYWAGKKQAFMRAIEIVIQGITPPTNVDTILTRVEELDSILRNKDPECEPCEEIAVGRAQAYHEVREFLRTGKWA
ncbi:MAG: hypothetical protein WC891_08940 [Actinomycetota bacterium]